MRQVTDPIESKTSRDGTEYSHPSYGIVRFNRSHGTARDLFGSSISHQNIMSLTISRCTMIRDLNYDRYHPREELIEIEMSENQFAQLVSSVNSGSGTPCTIRKTESEWMVPGATSVSERKRINSEFSAMMREVTEKLQHASNAVDKLLASKSITKAELRVVQEDIFKANQHIASNASFIHSQFNRACDDTVTEARAEIEIAFQSLIGRLGNQKLIDMIGVTEAPALDAIEHVEESQ